MKDEAAETDRAVALLIVAQAMWTRMAWNSLCFCLSPPNAKILGLPRWMKTFLIDRFMLFAIFCCCRWWVTSQKAGESGTGNQVERDCGRVIRTQAVSSHPLVWGENDTAHLHRTPRQCEQVQFVLQTRLKKSTRASLL